MPGTKFREHPPSVPVLRHHVAHLPSVELAPPASALPRDDITYPEVHRVRARIHPPRHLGALLGVLALVASLLAGPNSAEAAPDRREPVVPAAGYGFGAGMGLMRLEQDQLDVQLDAVAATGARWLRMSIDWPSIERQRGVFDWSQAERVIRGARERGLKVLAVIAYTPSWARGFWTRQTAPPTVSARYGTFAGIVARRFGKRIAAYELWNEPNLPRMFGGKVNVAKYTELLRVGYAAIKAVRPRATVLSAGLSPDGTDPATFMKGIYAHGGGDSFDAVGLHPYIGTGDTTHTMRHMSDMIAQVRAVLDRRRDRTVEVWLTEFGTSAYAGGPTQENQAKIALEQLEVAARTPLVGPCFIYGIQNTGPAISSQYGQGHLLTSTGEPKPLLTLLAD